MKEDIKLKFENPYKKLLKNDYWKTRISYIEFGVCSLNESLKGDSIYKYQIALRDVRYLEKKVKEIKKTIYELYKKAKQNENTN